MAVEDWSGLWEAIWGLHTISPDTGDDEIHALAEDTLRELLDKGWVTLIYFNEGSQERTEIPRERIGGLLKNRDTWSPPDQLGETHVRFVATEAGKKAWLKEKPEVHTT